MPIYDYTCRSCNITWEDVLPMADRKLPESQPCPHCGSHAGQVLQTAANTNLGIGYSFQTTRDMKTLARSKFQDKLSEIHANNPGSILDQTSKITPISL